MTEFDRPVVWPPQIWFLLACVGIVVVVLVVLSARTPDISSRPVHDSEDDFPE